MIPHALWYMPHQRCVIRVRSGSSVIDTQKSRFRWRFHADRRRFRSRILVHARCTDAFHYLLKWPSGMSRSMRPLSKAAARIHWMGSLPLSPPHPPALSPLPTVMTYATHERKEGCQMAPSYGAADFQICSSSHWWIFHLHQMEQKLQTKRIYAKRIFLIIFLIFRRSIRCGEDQGMEPLWDQIKVSR